MTNKKPLTKKEILEKLKIQRNKINSKMLQIKKIETNETRKERANLLINFGLMMLQKNGKKLEEYKPLILQFIAEEKKKNETAKTNIKK